MTFTRHNVPLTLELPAGTHRLCGCGESSAWPVCDTPRPSCETAAHTLALSKPQFVWVCQCQGSTTMPFCDGEGHLKKSQVAGS